MALCLCNYTHEDELFIQVYSVPTPLHSKTAFGKMHRPLLNADMQYRLTAALRNSKYTCGDLLFIQVPQ